MSYFCWECNIETLDEPCDADGTGETGMIWPPCCRTCSRDYQRPIRLESFLERYPGAIVARTPLHEHHRINQAYCRIGLERGWTWDMFAGKEKAQS